MTIKDSEFTENTQNLQSIITEKNFVAFCDEKILAPSQNPKKESDAGVWEYLKMLFAVDPRVELLNKLGSNFWSRQGGSRGEARSKGRREARSGKSTLLPSSLLLPPTAYLLLLPSSFPSYLISLPSFPPFLPSSSCPPLSFPHTFSSSLLFLSPSFLSSLPS